MTLLQSGIQRVPATQWLVSTLIRILDINKIHSKAAWQLTRQKKKAKKWVIFSSLSLVRNLNAWRKNPIEKANDSKRTVTGRLFYKRSQLREAEFLSEMTPIPTFNIQIYI